MKPLTIIMLSTVAFYGMIFLLWHCWVKPVYLVARTGKVLTKSQKISQTYFYPYMQPAAGLTLFVFFIVIILKVIVLLVVSALQK